MITGFIMPVPASAWLAAASALQASGLLNLRGRLLGGALLTATIAAAATPAYADQTLMVEDNARVDCTASAKDLTRISLVGDEFASVSKVQAASELDDFNVVNEPTRGDIYIAVPETYRAKTLSFFGTTKKGFVYKFACRVEAVEAQQVFLSNKAAVAKAESPTDEEAPDGDETAVRLVQAMASQKVVPGYHMARSALVPVRSGDLSVQLVSEYQGLDYVGRVIRIENLGSKAAQLSESLIAPAASVAVSIANPELQPRQVTAAYVVLRKQGVRP
ncbi:type-F conjugative transfer system secretin TraK [Novosphingobium sp. G106]|uniref:type-F conjugative transfer system secretin TraK n=1 Tax=Novosphingobium sp. G106 TaxID=2849500 RepID=UPI0020C530D1|nr:type-F conjugative transfer system secretin TraK [Novosphingobium sp. G106]